MKKIILLTMLLITTGTLSAQTSPERSEEDVPIFSEEVMEEPNPIRRQLTPNPEAWNNNYGLIKRLYPSEGKFYFSLKGGLTAMNPKNGYYMIDKSHDNYEALVDVLLMAAETGKVLNVRTEPKLTKDEYAEVRYLVLDF